MFASRKSLFVDLLKWDLPVLEGRYEIDQFDDEYARYLILADRGDGHLGSARLLPTMRPHILDSLYAGLCAAARPRRTSVVENTRFCPERHTSAVERPPMRYTLVNT